MSPCLSVAVAVVEEEEDEGYFRAACCVEERGLGLFPFCATVVVVLGPPARQERREGGVSFLKSESEVMTPTDSLTFTLKIFPSTEEKRKRKVFPGESRASLKAN